YAGLRERLFVPRADDHYLDFAPDIDGREAIKRAIEEAPGTQARAAELRAAIEAWWARHRPLLEELPRSGNVFALRRSFLDSIAEALVPLDLLDVHKVRGALA